MLLVSQLINNSANRTVLAYLADRGLIELPPVPQPHRPAVLQADVWYGGEEVSPFDEGGIQFIHDYGHAVPARAKQSFSLVHAFVHDETGEIFAVHWGRLTIVVRYDDARTDLVDHDGLRIGETFDGDIDARALGPGWALGEYFGDAHDEALQGNELDQALRFAWEAADARAAGRGSSAHHER